MHWVVEPRVWQFLGGRKLEFWAAAPPSMAMAIASEDFIHVRD